MLNAPNKFFDLGINSFVLRFLCYENTGTDFIRICVYFRGCL